MADFRIESLYNDFLPQGSKTVNAVLVVTASGTSGNEEVALRVWTPQSVEIVLLKQIDPSVDLTDSYIDLTRTQQNVHPEARGAPRVRDYATGAWCDEARDYLLSMHVSARALAVAARVTLLVGGQTAGSAVVSFRPVSSDVSFPLPPRPLPPSPPGPTEPPDTGTDGGVREPRSPFPKTPSTAGHIESPASDSETGR